MASLTHVCYWSDHGWKHITAEEASKKYPAGTVSVHSGLFICELCNQYVTLTCGSRRSRYFRHSRGEDDKSCLERTFGANYNPSYSADEYELPIRIRDIDKTSFTLELGLLYLPRAVLTAQREQKVIIRLEGVNRQQSYVYSFERLHTETITYLSIGDVPAPKYLIESGDALNRFWPRTVMGIGHNGKLFDMSTNKMLIDNADVQMGQEYYLLCATSLYNKKDINIEKICERRIENTSWKIYKIKATTFSKEVAKFFLELNYRLTDSPLSIQPIWPVYIEKPYVIQHNKNYLMLHMLGSKEVTIKALPKAAIQKYSFNGMEGHILDMVCNDRQQLISIGRTKVLQYTYFWRANLNEQVDIPEIKVIDVKGRCVNPGISDRLPVERSLLITAPFDGRVIIQYKDTVVDKRNVYGDKCIELYGLNMGYRITVFQGLDIEWSISFESKMEEKNIFNKDQQILKRLESYRGEMIPIGHSLGGLAGKLTEYPNVRKWLYKKIHQGKIPKEAFRYFRSFISSL